MPQACIEMQLQTLCSSTSLTYLWASAPPEEMQISRERALTKAKGCMSVSVSSRGALFPTGLTLLAVSSDYSSWGLTLIKMLRREQVSVEPLLKARQISRISRAQSQSLLQGRKTEISPSHNFPPLPMRWVDTL